MEQVGQVGHVEHLDDDPDARATPDPAEAVIDLRFDVPVIDLRTDPIDLGFDVAPESRLLRKPGVVIDLRDDDAPVVVLADPGPMALFAGPDDDIDAAAEVPAALRLPDLPTQAPETLSLPASGMWSAPDRCLPLLVNRARFRQGGVSAVSAERTDLTELVVLVSRSGDVDARRLAHLARGCR